MPRGLPLKENVFSIFIVEPCVADNPGKSTGTRWTLRGGCKGHFGDYQNKWLSVRLERILYIWLNEKSYFYIFMTWYSSQLTWLKCGTVRSICFMVTIGLVKLKWLQERELFNLIAYRMFLYHAYGLLSFDDVVCRWSSYQRIGSFCIVLLETSLYSNQTLVVSTRRSFVTILLGTKAWLD